MRKFYILFLGMLIALNLTGCGDRADHASSDIDGERRELSSDTFEDKENNAVSESEEKPEQQKMVFHEFPGIITCVSDGDLLLIGKRLMLLDSRTLEVQKEAENTAPLLVEFQVYTHEDTYVLMGELSAEWRFNIIEYDRDLHVKQIIDVEEATASEREIMNCKLLSGGDKLLYNNINGFYLFDFSSGETIDLTQDGIFVNDFVCREKDGEILFSGADSSGERVLGTVGMDGKKQQKERREHLWGEMWAFEDFVLIEEAELVGREKEGMVFRYDVEEGIRSFSLTDSKENGNISVSCQGSYYSTCTKMQDDVTRYLIRIYSSEDGTMVKELPLTYEEYGENFRLNGHLICDDVNKIILYGTWRGQETDTWIVTKSL